MDTTVERVLHRRLASAKLNVSFDEMEDLDFILVLEARGVKKRSTRRTLIPLLSNRGARYRDIDRLYRHRLVRSLARSRLSSCTRSFVRSRGRQKPMASIA